MAIDEYDDQTIRCLRIGDSVPFKYCRTSGEPFCWVIIECWAPRIDIGQFLADHYSAEQIHQGLERPQSGGRIKKMIDLAGRHGS